MRTDPSPTTCRRRRWVAASLLGALVVVAAAGCSSDEQDAGPDRTTTTVASGTSADDGTATTSSDGGEEDPAPTTDPTTTTEVPDPTGGSGTTQAPAGEGTTAGLDAPGAEDYSGPFDGQDGDTSISFERGADVSSVEVKGLEVRCEPIDNTGDPRTKTIDLSFPKVSVRDDGSVDLTLDDARYQPSLSGSFTPDGSFAGSVFLAFDDDGYACGGDYPFIAKPR